MLISNTVLDMSSLRMLLICCVFSSSIFAQETSIKNLVFEGAGLRGLAYAGALKTLEEKQITSQIEKVGGTSAGAIISLLFSLGYTADEMEHIIANTKFQKFNDGRFFFIGGIVRMKKKFGWYRGEKFKAWLSDLIEAKTGNADITFQELYDAGYKDLYVTTTCLNKQELIVLSRKNYPKMMVKDAVRISMSVPMYYQAVFVDKEGKTYRKQNEEASLDVMVDGGLTGNFPIDMFDAIRYNQNQEEIRIPNYETLGLRIDSERQIKQDRKQQRLAPFPITDFSDFIGAFYVMTIGKLNRNQLTDDDWNRTISISSVGISPKVKKLSAAEKNKLINSGKSYTEAYFNKASKP